MCGIVGYIGHEKALQNVILGLEKLEYRGYDSAGISVLDQENNRFVTIKTTGRVETLKKRSAHVAETTLGIGHTRWATHGGVSEVNAHPHIAYNGRFILVHNGVIDNYKALKSDYLKGIEILSDTDTEVIASLIAHFAQHEPTEVAIEKTLRLLEGSFALLIIDQDQPHRLYGAKNKSPLIVAKNDSEWFLASDLLALPNETESFHVMDDHTWFQIHDHQLYLYQFNGKPIDPNFETFRHLGDQAQRGDHAHFMLKEIHEQPAIIEALTQRYQSEAFDPKLLETLKTASSIEIIAAGTSWHAGLVAKTLFEGALSLPVHVHIASEFAYHPPHLSSQPCFIFISQSGETADLIACHALIKNKQAPLVTLTNVPTSTLARAADFVCDLEAGPEIAVASTKAYTAQLTMIVLLVAQLTQSKSLYADLLTCAAQLKTFLNQPSLLQPMVQKTLIKNNAFYMGRGLDYLTGLEAALKLKEISYIQTEGFAAGELKHGTIALIEDKTPVIALISDPKTSALTRNNIHEVEARGAHTLVIALASLAEEKDAIILPDVNPLLAPIFMVVPTQLIAYYAALLRGLDIDKPRNLAKSVTVE